MKRVVGLVLTIVLLLVGGGVVAVSATSGRVEGPDQVQATAAGPIIIDHTCTDLSKIPDYWLEEAKKLSIHYAHTSHGSQIVSGIDKLEQVQDKYAYHRFTAGSTPPSSLPTECTGVLCMYDGNPPETYITPEDYWSRAGGISRTEGVADTGLFDYSMWSWCGQQSSNSEATVQEYLDTMAGYETAYPNMRFILMTGHTDGGSTTLDRNNDVVRQYAQDHNKVLFDFADIETYDPLGGGPYINNGSGNCTWCVDFCANHPEYCTDLPSSCAHTSAHTEDRLFCKLKGNAFWWMMARLAGWPGPEGTQQPDLSPSYKVASTAMARLGERITYTVVIRNLVEPVTNTVRFSDTIRDGMVYVSGTLTATAGFVDEAFSPTLRWLGVLTPTPAVTITYAAKVVTTATRFITNVAEFLMEPGYGGDPPIATRYTLQARILANGFGAYLPLVVKSHP